MATVFTVTNDIGGLNMSKWGPGTLALQGILGNTNGVTLHAGKLLLVASNSYTGGTFINGGLLVMGNGGALGAMTNTLTMNAGMLDLNGNNLTVGGLAGNTAAIITDSNAIAGVTTLTVGFPPSVNTWGGIISNGPARRLSLTVTGGTTLTMTNRNNYTGDTRIDAGSLVGLGGSSIILAGRDGAVVGTTNIFLVDGGVLILTNTTAAAGFNNNRLNDNAVIRLNDAALMLMNDGGNTNFNRTVGAVLIEGGNNSIFMRQSGGASTNIQTINSINRGSIGALLDVKSVGVGSQIGNGISNVLRFASVPTLVNGILPWATVNQTNFATYNSGTINSLSNYSAYQTAAWGGWAGTDNVRQNTGFTADTNATINSLNLHLISASATVDLGGNTLTLNSGGLILGGTNMIMGSFAGAGYGAILTNGYLTAGSGASDTALVVRVFQPAATNYAIITDNGPNGSIALVKGGAGTLVMDVTSTNNYTGGTFLNNGTLYIFHDANLGAPGSTIVINGAELRVGADITFSNRPVWSRAGDAAFNIDAGVTLTATDTVFGTGSLTKYGLGTMVLGTNNTYAGGTLLSNGTLYISADSSLGASGGAISMAYSGTLRVTNDLVFANRPITLGVGGGQLSVDSSSTLTITDLVSGVGMFAKVGPGTLALSAVNTYGGASATNYNLPGGTVISQGTLVVGSEGALGAGLLTMAGGTLVAGPSGRVTNVMNLTATTTFDAASGSLTLAAPVLSSNVSGLVKSGAGTLTMAGYNTYAGGTLVDASALVLSNALLTSTLTLTNGATATIYAGNAPMGLTGDYYGPNMTAPVTGNALKSLSLLNNFLATNGPMLVYAGNALSNTNFEFGTVAQNPQPSFPMPFNVGGVKSIVRWQGVITITNSGVYSFPVAADDRAMLYIDGNLLATNNFTAGTNLVAGPHHIVVAYDNAGGGNAYMYVNYITPDSVTNRLPNAILSSGGVVGSLAGDAASALTLGNGTLMVFQTNDTLFAGSISGLGALAKSGPNMLTLSGNNTYSGGTWLDGGALTVTNANNIGGAGASLTFAGGILQVAGTAMTNLDNMTVNWTYFNGGFDIADGGNIFVVTNAIGGISGLTKNGAGTLALAGANTFGGQVTINAGTIRVDNAFALGAPGPLQINGGTLDLNGNNTYITSFSSDPNSEVAGLITDNSSAPGLTVLNMTNVPAYSIFGGVIANGVNGREVGFTLGSPAMWSGTGVTPMVFTNNNTYTGPTFVQGSSLVLSNQAGALSGTTNIFIRQGAALIVYNDSLTNNIDRINDVAKITLRGGTLVFINNGSVTDYSETIGDLVSERAGSAVQVREAPAGGTSTLNFGNFVREGGGINFTGSLFGTTRNAITFLNGATLQTNSILGAWAWVNGMDWATYDPNNNVLSNFTAYTLNGLPTAWDNTVNARVTTNFFLPAAADRTVYSLSLGMTNRGPVLNVLNLGTNQLTIASGGLLFSSNSWTDIRLGRLTAGALNQEGELIIYANNTLTVTNYITAVITNNGTGPLTLNKLGPGVVVLGNSTNTYTGGTFIGDGLLQLGGNYNAFAIEAYMPMPGGTNILTGLGTGEVTIRSGGELRFAGNTVGVGLWLTNAVDLSGGKISDFSGQHHLSGPISVTGLTNSTLEALVPGRQLSLDGAVSGPGGLRIIGNSSAVILTNGANTFSGGVFVDGGVLLLGNTNNTSTDVAGINGALGTGGILATNVFGGVGAAYPIDQAFLNIINARTVTNVTTIVLGASSSADLDFTGLGNLANTYLGVVPGSGLQNFTAGDPIYSNAITYTGAVTPANYTYRFKGASGASGVLVVGSTLTNAGDGTPHNLVVGNEGIVILTNNNTLTGATLVNAGGTLMIGTNTATGSLGPGVVTNFGTIRFVLTNDASYTFTNRASFFGGGPMIKEYTNTLQFAGSGTGYWGAVTVNAGMLQAGTNFAFGNGAGVMTLNGTSVLDLNGCNAPVGGLVGTPLVAVTDNSALGGYNMLNLSNASGVIFAGAIRDGAVTRLSVSKLGPGVQAFSGVNTYSGGTIIGAGQLRAVYGAGLPYAGNLTISNGAFETSLFFTNALGSGSGQVQLPYNTNSLNPGNWVIAGFSAYGTNIVVNLGGGSVLNWGSPSFNSAALLLNDVTATAMLVFSNSLDLNANGPLQRPIYVNAGLAVLAGGISNSTAVVAGFNKYGAGVLALTGTNYFTGPVNVYNGTLFINSDSNFGTPGSAISLGLAGQAGSVTLRVTNDVVLNNRPITIGTATVFQIDADSMLTISNTLTGNIGVNAITKTGLGTLQFTTNQNPGLTAQRWLISQGTLLLGTTNNLKAGSALMDISSSQGALGASYPLDQAFLNWAALRIWTNPPNVGVQGAIVLGADSANPLNFSLAMATNGLLVGFQPLTNAFLGASEGTWTYSGALSPWTNSALAIRLFGTATGTNVLQFGGGNGTLNYTPVVGSGTNVLIGPANYAGGSVVQFTNYNVGMSFTVAVAGGVFRAATNIGLPSTASLMLTGGVFELISEPGGLTLNNALSRAPGGIWLASGTNAGFSTINGPMTINLGGAGATLQFGNTNFNPTTLVLGTNTTDSLITFQNGLDVAGNTRTMLVNSAVLMAGRLTNSGGAGGILFKQGLGTLILSNVTTINQLHPSQGLTILENGSTTVVTNYASIGRLAGDVGALTVRGNAVFTNAGDLNVSDVAGTIGVLRVEDAALVKAKNLYVGKTGPSTLGVVYQSGGVVMGANSPSAWNIGSGAGTYGYYNLSGGVLNPGGANFQLGSSGIGVFDMTGGAFTNTSNWIQIGSAAASGIGVFNVSGGIVDQVGANNAILLGNTTGQGILSIMDAASVNASGRVSVAWAANSIGVVNLLGGTLTTPKVDQPNTNGYGVFNFNGGTLRAAATTNFFMQGLNAAYIYGGGATINTQTNRVVLNQALLAPEGNGVVNIPVAYGGQGYIAPPIVQFMGGGGSNATAYAQIDPVSGSVTNIVVTNPGLNYTAAPYVFLLGGTATNGFAAVAGVPVLAANASGGLTKDGAGTLILGGANTYAGPTTINGGTLQVDTNGATATLGGGAVTNNGTLVFSRSDTAYTNSAPISGSGAVINNGDGMVTLAGANSYGGGTWVSNGVLQFNAAGSVPGAGLVTVVSNAVAALNFAGVQAALASFDSTNTFGTIALTAASAADAIVDFSAAGLSNAWLGALGTVNFAGVVTPFGTNYLMGGGGGVLSITNVLADDGGARNVVIGGSAPVGVVQLLGTNTYTGVTAIVGGVLRADDGWGLGGGNLSINGGVLEISTNFYRALGTDANQVQLSGTAGFSAYGGTGGVINLYGDGSMLTWGAAGFTLTNLVLNAATANASLAFVNGLDLGGLNRTVSVYSLTAPALISGGITNGTLSKTGPGTLVLSGNNGHSSTFINGGTLQIGANNTLLTNSMVSFGDNTNNPNSGGTLDLGSYSQTIGLLSVQTTNNLATNYISIGAGQQLAVLGNVVVGANATAGAPTNGGFANLVMSGAGSFVVTGVSFRVSALDAQQNYAIRALLDMSGLAQASINLGSTGSFLLGDLSTSPGGSGNDSSLLILASNTTITAGNLDVGPGSRSAGLQVLRLGVGTNTINVNTFNIGSPTLGSPRDGGTLVFNSATGELIVRGANGVGRANFNVGAGSPGTAASMTNTVDLTGHNVDLLLGMLTVGEQPRSGNLTNLFFFDSGVLDANGLRIGNRPSNAGNVQNGFSSIVNIGGGVVTIGGSGIVMGTSYGTNYGTNMAVLNITGGAVTVGSNIVMLTQNSRTSVVYSTINITGGSLTVFSNIITGVTAPFGTTRVATINLAGGLLDMTGHSIGTNNALIDVLNLQNGTLRNLGGFNNGAPLLKSSPGVVVLAGSNTYANAMIVSGGSLLLSGYSTGAGTLAVTGATMNVAGGTGYYGNIWLDGANLYVSGNGVLNLLGDKTISTGNGIVVSNGTLNAGNWLSGGFWFDPSTGHFANIVFTNGFWYGVDAGARIYISGTLDNQLTNRVGELLTPSLESYSFQGTLAFTNAPSGGVAAAQQVEVASLRTSEAAMAATNFFIGTFMVGDPVTGAKARVQLVDNRTNAPANAVLPSSEILAVSNLVVYSGSTLDWNNRSGFAYNVSNSGTMLWTNAGALAGAVTRLDVVNTFTNQGAMLVGNGSVLQLSNAFLNGSSGNISLFAGGALTNFAASGVLTNLGTIYGDGLVAALIANNAGGTIAATNGGSLLLSAGIANNINYGNLGTTNGGGTLSINNTVLTNASGATIGALGGVVTLVGAGSNVVNHGTIGGFGTMAVQIGNESDGQVIAYGGVLSLAGGFTNDAAGTSVNAGLLAALGAGSELVLNQAITNVGTIQLSHATAVFTAPAVTSSGTIAGNGTFNAVLNNAGTVVANNAGQTLTFAHAVNNSAPGVMTADTGHFWFSNAVSNAGSIVVQNAGHATFGGAVTNNGTLAFGPTVNPSTAIITGTLLMGQNGVVTMGNVTNNTLVIQGDFLNRSTNNQAFNMANGTVVVGGSTPLTGLGVTTNLFEVAGNDMGYGFAGYTTNFAIGTLNITNHMSFVGNGLAADPAQYVDVLHLFNGATMKLIQLTVYVANQFIYEDGSGTKVLTGAAGDAITEANKDNFGLVNVFLENGGQIVFVPEPGTGVLLACGALVTVWRKRRRKGKLARPVGLEPTTL